MTASDSYRTIIVDDEFPARVRLKELATKYSELFRIQGEAENGEEAVEMINRLRPDLIFLDIQMPGLDGFEVLKKLSYMPIVIFCTAFDQYALKAFEASCVDYLLKPVAEERFSQTVEKLKKFNGPVNQANIYGLIEKLSAETKREVATSIPVKLGDRVIFVRLNDVSHFKADEKYVSVITKFGKSHIIDTSLRKLEEKLPTHFVRVHKSFIINRNLLKEVRKHFNNRFVLVLEDYEQNRITSGRSYYSDIKELFEL